MYMLNIKVFTQTQRQICLIPESDTYQDPEIDQKKCIKNSPNMFHNPRIPGKIVPHLSFIGHPKKHIVNVNYPQKDLEMTALGCIQIYQYSDLFALMSEIYR